MIPKRFEDIGFSDLEALINNQVAEGKTIEYKKEIVTNASSDKEPFLAGVSAFANTIGGDFIIGNSEYQLCKPVNSPFTGKSQRSEHPQDGRR